MVSLLVCAAILAAPPLPEVKDNLVLSDIHIRDPFILPVPDEKMYYLFGSCMAYPEWQGFLYYTSPNLEHWKGPFVAFEAPPDWNSENYWAPEVHAYQGRYYLFATFKRANTTRGTYGMSADKPGGPYHLINTEPLTPKDWFALDGTLYVDKGAQPWLVFCHEWVQVGNGEIRATRLKADFSGTEGEPILLFRASDAPWERGIDKQQITDGPFLYRGTDDTLWLLWSSCNKQGRYTLGVAKSTSGDITGPWKQEPTPLFEQDGGHGMVFKTFDGHLMVTLHQPNKSPSERPCFFALHEKDGKLVLN